MTARERLHSMIRTDDGDRTVWSEDEATTALDAYRTEVLAAGAAMLRRQSRHHLNRPHFNAGLRQAAVLLDRLTTRGADSVNDGDFFQAGHTYQASVHADLVFECLAMSVDPDTGERAAVGWRFGPPHNGIRPGKLAGLGADDWACCDWTDTAREAS